MHVHVSVCVCVRMCAPAHACELARVYVYAFYTYMHESMYLRLHIAQLLESINELMGTCIDSCNCASTCI